jgi:urease accessory protein
VHARASLEAVVDGGRTRCRTLRSSPPLTLRQTPDAVYLVGSAAGPLGGDDLHVDVRIGDGAELTVRSAAATIALPGVTGEASHSGLHVEVGAGARLQWSTEPLLLVEGCDHRVHTRIHLGAGARVVFRELVVRGRHREASGSLAQRLDVECDGRPVLRTELRVGPRWPGADGPAGAGAARAIAQTLLVGTDPLGGVVERPGVRAALMTVEEGVALLSETAAEPAALASCPFDALR